MKNPNTNKHLTFEERCKIEEYINKGFRKYQIANELNKSQSTILREIRNNRVLKPRKIFNENPFNCIHLKDCKVCTGKCRYYETEKCNRRDKFIGACNNCPDIKKCKLDQYFYKDKLSDEEYQKIFSLLLTDRGTEFSKPIQFEVNIDTGEIRSKIFYCDAQMPSQKPHVENNHNLVREILPNGQNWTSLTQDNHFVKSK